MSRLIDINAVIRMLNTLDRYTSTELTLCDTDKTFPKNEVFVVDDVYEGLEKLPSAEPPSRCVAKIEINKEDIEELVAEKVEKIKEMLKSQSERKKGKWDFIGWQMFQCSECKHTFTQDFLEGWKEYTYESHFPPFCPNCGADMRGVQE